MHSKDTSVHSSHVSWCTELSLGSQAFVASSPAHAKTDKAKASSIWIFLVCKYGGAGNLWEI